MKGYTLSLGYETDDDILFDCKFIINLISPIVDIMRENCIYSDG